MANPSEEPLVERGVYAGLEDQINLLMLENANLRLTIDDQSEEIAKCKILKYEAVLDEMEEFCTLYDDAADDDPVRCGWRNAILRMREIRRA